MLSLFCVAVLVLLTSRFMLSLILLFLCSHVLVLFSIAITSRGEKRAGLHYSRAFVCLSYMR